MSLLEVRSVSVVFGGLAALKEVDLTIQEGEIVGLIGPNGAGKTTLFNCLSGFQPVDEGAIFFQDMPFKPWLPIEIAALGLARTFQTSRIFKRMTVLDHVCSGATAISEQVYGGPLPGRPGSFRKKRGPGSGASRSLSFFEDRLLAAYLDDFADTLSYANRRRLEIARALVSEPKLLLLDEPTAGMNPHESAGIARLIRKIRESWGSRSFLSSTT